VSFNVTAARQQRCKPVSGGTRDAITILLAQLHYNTIEHAKLIVLGLLRADWGEMFIARFGAQFIERPRLGNCEKTPSDEGNWR